MTTLKVRLTEVEGFMVLVNEAMEYIHKKMKIRTRLQLYWALVIQRHCSDSIRICFIFVSIHKKLCHYRVLDAEREFNTFLDKLFTHLNEGTHEGLNEYLANCEVIERIFFPFGKGPIRNLINCCNFKIFIFYNFHYLLFRLCRALR